MDVPHARADTQVVARVVQCGEHLHAVAGCFDGGDVRVEVANSADELIELRVAHVRVDLRLRFNARGRQAEGADSPLQVGRLVCFLQWQQLADGGLVDLDDLRTSVDEVADLVAQGQRHLVGGVAEWLVITDEGPCEHRDWAGEHALHWLVGQLLGFLEPRYGHGVRTANVAEQDWRTDAAGTVRLDPRMLGGVVALELLGEVLNHVVALWFAVDEHVEAEVFLALDDVCDFVDHGLVVLLFGELTLAQRGACLADLGGLREGADRRGWQWWQVQFCLLRGAAFFDVAAVAVGFGDFRGALADLGVVRQFGSLSGRHCLTRCGQRLRVFLGLLAAQCAGEECDFLDLLCTECEPAAQFVAQRGFAVEGVWHVQQGCGGGDGDWAAGGEGLQGVQRGVQVGAPDVASVDDANDQQFFTSPAWQFLAASDGVYTEGVDTGAGEGLDGEVAVTVVGLDQ